MNSFFGSDLRSSSCVRSSSAVPELLVIQDDHSGHNAHNSQSSERHRVRGTNAPPPINSSHRFSILYRIRILLFRCKHALYCNIGSTVMPLEEDEVCGSAAALDKSTK
ncbi:hypothetical protein T10_12218 [Trichinella papuae]|uniref:Uncharacterized protein n=1 Tax=Trichinella papuae TaxID=268474 RepID=A0A0V1MU41_9BILA|nr:hypothetical protein T10_12218 [Trichinella papuae]